MRPHRRFVAPWVRTRLRTAPGAALALGLLVLFTSFLAAAFPRAVDAYENRGLRHDITTAAPSRSGLELTTPPPPIERDDAARDASLLPARLGPLHRQVLGLLPEPLRADPGQSAYGVRTAKALVARDRWLPRPNARTPSSRWPRTAVSPNTPSCARAGCRASRTR